MDDAYSLGLQAVADSYESEVAAHGGKSLARVATIVVSSGAFFQRIRAGKSFSVGNLDKLASWFRVPANWPAGSIPHDAVSALVSIGRPPLASVPHSCRTTPAPVTCESSRDSQRRPDA